MRISDWSSDVCSSDLYEPQKASDVFAMYQSLVNEAIIPEELLWNCTPAEKVGNVDHLMEVLDWELNVDPNMMQNRYMERSEERRGGKECVSTCRSWGSPYQ